METLAVALIAIVSFPSYALDVEIGTGYTRYNEQHNGVWWQESFPHSLDLTAVPLTIGVSEQIGRYRYRAEFAHLGGLYSNAIATLDRFNSEHYAKTCGEDCELYRYLGRGSVSGVALTAMNETRVFGLPIYGEAGVFVFRSKWAITKTPVSGAAFDNPNAYKDKANDAPLTFGPVVGVGLRGEAVDVGVRYYHVDMSDDVDSMPSLAVGAWVLHVRSIF